MKFRVGLAVCALLMAVTVWAQTADEFQGYMKSNQATMTDLNKSLAAKDGAMADKDVRTIQENLAKVMIYFQTRNLKDGVKFAQDGTYALAEVGLLASQGKFDEASAAMKKVQSNCAGCHMAHREKEADGSYKIK